MAEEIKQVLGFDASTALKELDTLDKSLKGFQSRLNSFDTTFSRFNKGAGKVVSALIQIETRAKNAQTALGKGFTTPVAPKATQATKALPTDSLTKLRKETLAAEQALIKTGRAGQTAGQKIKDSMDGSAKRVQVATVSFETLARVILTQLVVRALGSLQRALRNSVTQAFELERAVREISTIDPRVSSNIEKGFDISSTVSDVKSEVVELANAFNIPVLESARGLYQAISNQVAKTGDASERARQNIEFLTTAFKFSKAAVVDAESAVNLLAGTINAYGLETSKAEEVASKFFKTIELGRTTGRELANTLGTVLPVARELGVALDEVNSAFVAITIGGVDSAKTATQLRGVLNSLLKPTREMKEAFDELNVAGGEELIELFGLQGGLKALIDTTDGSAAAISKLIPRVRGLAGGLRLASDEGAKAFNEALEGMTTNITGFLDEKFEIIIDNNAFEVEKDLNKLRNFLITDFGDSFIKLTSEVLKFTGGIDATINTLSNLGNVAKLVIPTLGVLASGMLVIGASAKIMAKDVALASKAIPLLGVIAAGVVAFSSIAGQIQAAKERAVQAEIDALEQIVKARREVTNKIISIEEERTNKTITIAKRFVGEQRKVNAEIIKDAKRTATIFEDTFSSAINKIASANENLASSLGQKLQQTVQSKGERSLQRDKLGLKILDEEFNIRQRNASAVDKVRNATQKLRDEQGRLTDLLRKARKDRSLDLKLVEEQEARTISAAREVDTLTQATPGTRDDRFGAKILLDQLRGSRDVSLKLEKIEARRIKQTKKNLETVKSNNLQIQILKKELIDISQVTKSGKLVPVDDKSIERFKALNKQIRKLTGQNIRISDIELGKDAKSLRTQLELALSSVEIKTVDFAPGELLKLAAKVNSAIAFDASKIKDAALRIAIQNATGSKTFATGTDFIEFLQEEFKVKDLEATIKLRTIQLDPSQKEFKDAIGSLREEVNKERDKLASNIQIGSETGFLVSETTIDRTNTILDFIDQKLNSIEKRGPIELFKADFSEVSNLERFLNPIIGIFETMQKKLGAINNLAKDIADNENQITSAAKERAELILEDERGGVSGQTLNELKTTAETTKLFKQELDNSKISIDNLNTSAQSVNTTIKDTVANLGEGATHAERIAKAFNSVSGGGSPALARNGLVSFFAGGGFAGRGTDVIPAMLSPNESVISAKNTRKFFSQIQAMNAGATPVFRQSGGVTNNVGDVNVTVQGGNTPHQTGRVIGQALRRDLRRNAIQL